MTFRTIRPIILLGDNMPNYKEPYFKMFRASEKAIDLLVEAQRECEELYLSSPETELKIVDLRKKMQEPDKD